MAGEQTSLELRKLCSDIVTTITFLEDVTLWANKAELYIGIIKEAIQKDIKEYNWPLVFWYFYVEQRALIKRLTTKDTFKLHGMNAHMALTGEEGDISNLCQYKCYEWCYFCKQK